MASCRTNADNIKIEPAYYTWADAETTKVTCVADVADSLDGTSFNLWSALDATAYYVYIGTDPMTAGKTGIGVTITTGDSAATIAGLCVTAINAVADFHCKIDPCDSTSFIIMNKNYGTSTDVVDVDTGFTITKLRDGLSLELGFVDGDVDLPLTEDLFDVTSHQTGTQIIQALRTGRSISNIVLPLKESDAVKLKAIIETSGAEYTPSEMGSTAVSGWGSEDTKTFSNITSVSRRLIVHPISKASNVLSEDFCFFRAYPIPTSITISGESNRVINVEFKIIPDPLLATQVRLFAFGDHTQNFLA